jgi:hypothetical protein
VVDAWIAATKWHSKSFQLLLQRIVAKNKKNVLQTKKLLSFLPGKRSSSLALRSHSPKTIIISK